MKDDSISPPFAAFAFKNESTGEVIVAYRGTDGLKDGSADLAILAGNWDPQFKQGMDFAKSVRDNPDIFPSGPDPTKLLVTGHSLGGTIAQITAYAFGLDGSTIDPGAALRIVQTAGFLGTAADLGLTPANFGVSASFTNYLVAGSVVSGNTGEHVGASTFVPSLTFTGLQAVTAFLIGLVNPVAGFVYAVGTDQLANKHPSDQVSQALGLLAGAQEGNFAVGSVKLVPKEIGTTDPVSGTYKPTYSQTEFEIRDAATGALQSTVKFSGSGADRMIEVFDGTTGSLKSTTTLAATGAITVRPINGSSIVVGYLPSVINEQDGSVTTTVKSPDGTVLSTKNTQTNDDGSTLATTTYPNGKVEILATDSNSQRSSLNVTTPTEGGGQFVETYTYINGIKTRQSSKSIDYDYSEAGITRTEVVTTASGSVRNVYNESDTLLLSEALPSAGPSNLDLSNAANVVTDLINFRATLASGAPDLYKFASGIVLLNKNFNTGGTQFPNFGTVATVAQGALSLYNLNQAFSTSGNELGKFSAVANGLNFLNNNFIGNASLTGALNGTGTTFSTAADGLITGTSNFGLANGGTVGILPALGLISSIKSGDPIGIAQSAIALFNPALLFTSGVGFTPLDWFFIGATILQTMFAPGPPKAWGVANVTYGEGINNLGLQVNASGDSFGTDRARAGLQNIVDYLQTNVIDSYNASHDASQQVGLIAQRLPGLAWRASDAGDPGFKLTDIDPLSGEQKYPYRRFDDNGIPFTSNAAAYQVDPSDPNQRGGMGQALVMSAYARQAIAPLWEVRTAKMQGDAGAVNAGLSEEERAAKAGLSAALDTAYAASHPNDVNADNKRVGSFMAVALDLNGDNTITNSTIAQNAVANAASGLNNGQGMSFNWDDQSYQKRVGWVGDGSQTTDGFLVLDRDFNQSVDNGTELFSNPLVADPAKGLRSLATWDADGDGRITAADPIYHQLKVWQDFDHHYEKCSYKQQFYETQQVELLEKRAPGASKQSSVPILGINVFGAVSFAEKHLANSQKRRRGPKGPGIQIYTPRVQKLIAVEMNGRRVHFPNQSSVNDSTWRMAA